jgi:hypothetical protein
MKYLIRLNPKAFNPLTRKVNAARLWEVEQCAMLGRDGKVKSEKVIWHCADIRIDGENISHKFSLPKEGQKPWEAEYWGACARGQDDVVEIHTGRPDASGN